MKNKEAVLKNNLYILKLIHKASPGRLPLGFLSVILSVATNFLFNVFLLRLVINGIQTGTSFSEILGYIIAVGLILIMYYILNNYYSEIFLPVSEKRIYRNIQMEVFAKAEQADLSCYENPEFYDKYMKAVTETNRIAQKVIASINDLLSNILTLFSVSLMIFIIDPIFILFAIVPIIYTLLFGKKLNRWYWKYNMEMTEKSRKRDYIKRLFYLADYAKEMRLTEIGNVLFKRFFEAIAELKMTIRKYGFKVAVLDYFSVVIQYVLLFVGAIFYAAYRTVVTHTMLFGDCVIVINNIVETASAMKGVVNGYMQLHSNALDVLNLRTFLEYEPKIKDGPLRIEARDRFGTLSLDDVCFSYSDGEPVLKNISFDIRPGEKIALVGHNGAGKTTLVKLLLRLYDPTSGTVLWNGKDIKNYKLADYRECFSAVFQHYKIFSMSLTENVLLKGSITDEDKKAALDGMKNSGIYDKAVTLPHREKTVLTKEFDPEGTVMSGGENQKIAIARIYTRPCGVVVLDEPSSALDPIAEYQMYEAMMKACADKSVIYISHRLSSAVLADRVYLLENGEIVESGTHFDLLRRGGKYADMWKKQSEQYRENGGAYHA